MIFVRIEPNYLLAACIIAFASYAFVARSQNAADAQICSASAVYASERTGVPIGVLRAISLTETGRKKSGKFLPWPWTVNMEGKGVWFDNQDDARAYVYKNYKRGARSFDVGCFQLNFKWHGTGFSSIDEMFEPNANALYAAKFLLDLFQEFGSWSAAAGAYHSRTPKYSKKYRTRFDRIFANLEGVPLSTAPVVVATDPIPQLKTILPTKARINQFALLRPGTGRSRGLGSLLPISESSNTTRFIGQNVEQ